MTKEQLQEKLKKIENSLEQTKLIFQQLLGQKQLIEELINEESK